MYDKTIFKPEEIKTLGRYKFNVIDAGPTSGQSDASLSSTEGSDTSSSNETAAPPSQFDLGDFSNMKPAEEAATGGQEDELPMLGGPETEK